MEVALNFLTSLLSDDESWIHFYESEGKIRKSKISEHGLYK